MHIYLIIIYHILYRSALEGHSTELCVALIQSVRPTPTSKKWIDGWMDEWMDGLMDEWIDGWIGT